MNPHLSWHDSLNTSMIDATPRYPITIYEIKIVELCVDDLPLSEARPEIIQYLS